MTKQLKTFSAPSSLGRREFLQMIPLLAAAPSVLAQDAGPVAVQKFTHVICGSRTLLGL